MATRIIRDGILTSERVNALSERAELFYRRLMSVVDDYGRYWANPTLLRASCYPLKLDCIKDDSISKYLAEAEDTGLIVRFMVAGKAYLEIQDFGQRIQSKSKFPSPEDADLPESTVIHGEPPEKTALVGVGVGVGVGVVPSSRKRRRPAEKTPFPDDFVISESVEQWAKAKGYTRLDEHLESFSRKARAKGYAYADWNSAFMEAVREDWAKLRGGGFNGAPPPTPTRQRKELGT